MNKWWAYLHSSGTLQLKRYLGQDFVLEDADESPFVIKRTDPFDASSREDAEQKAKVILRIEEELSIIDFEKNTVFQDGTTFTFIFSQIVSFVPGETFSINSSYKNVPTELLIKIIFEERLNDYWRVIFREELMRRTEKGKNK